MSLDLRPEVERIVRERAAAEGVSVDDLLARTFAAASNAGEAERRVRALLAQWQAEDRTPAAPSPHAPGSAPPGEALFARWRELDAAMTDEEREAEDRLWEEVQRGLDETRALLGMRRFSQ
jgi:hypothetical protein